MRMSLCVLVVLVVVDRPADIILSLIDLLMLLLRQSATICRTIGRRLVVDARLAVLDVPVLARRYLAGTNSLGNALLLILRSRARPRESSILRTPAIH